MNITDILDQKLQVLGDHIDSNIDKALQSQKDNLNQELDNLKTNEIAGLVEKYDKLQEQADSLEISSKRSGSAQQDENWVSSMISQIKGANGFADQVRSKQGIAFNVPMFSTKVGTPLTGANDFVDGTTSLNVVPPDYQQGIIFTPSRIQHVRQFLPTGTTQSDLIRYVVESSVSDGTAMKAEGANAGEYSFDLAVADAPVRTIASFVRLSNEMLEDVQGLTSYLTTRLPSKIRAKEDNILLFGSDSPSLTGLTESANSYTDQLADSNVNRFDILTKAVAQVRQQEYTANAIMVHPDDFYNLMLIKDAQGRYVIPETARFGGALPMIAGVPLIANTAMTTDKFLVGDFNLGAQLFDRQQSSIRFYEQDQDNVVKGVVTVVASERIALAVYRSGAFIFGDFSDALTAGAS
tara:strand:+ start:3447 stop:4673 length:1227 start_codon:yes stop_codon:yes gene_type:complete